MEPYKVISFNTQRPYSKEGQRILAVQIDGDVIFNDLTRGICQKLIGCDLSERAIMSLYDAGHYHDAEIFERNLVDPRSGVWTMGGVSFAGHVGDLTISRETARKNGLPTYFSGRKCKHGHLSQRRVSNGVCIECKKNVDASGRADGKKLDPHAMNKRSVPLPVLDDTTLGELVGVEFDTVGLASSAITDQQWKTLVKVAGKLGTMKNWLIGDLWNSVDYGSKADFMEHHDINPTSARIWGSIAKAIPHDMRRPNLSFSVHQELITSGFVQGTDQIIAALDRFELEGWSARQVRAYIKKHRQGETRPERTEGAALAIQANQVFDQLRSLETVPDGLAEIFGEFISKLSTFLDEVQ